jgi:hypothetical protein
MASTFADSDTGEPHELSTETLAASANIETPERRAMKTLYARMPELPPPLQMLMAGCPAELEDRRHRINCREIITRNVLALSTGVRRTVCWRLAPEIADYEDPFTMMELLQGKLLLLRHDDEGRLTRRQPAAEAFLMLAEHLDGARAVTRVELESHPDVCAFAVERPERPALAILWKDGDVFSGEDEPPTVVQWPWPGDHADAIDALGAHHTVERHNDGHLPVSITPLILVPTTP